MTCQKPSSPSNVRVTVLSLSLCKLNSVVSQRENIGKGQDSEGVNMSGLEEQMKNLEQKLETLMVDTQKQFEAQDRKLEKSYEKIAELSSEHATKFDQIIEMLESLGAKKNDSDAGGASISSSLKGMGISLAPEEESGGEEAAYNTWRLRYDPLSDHESMTSKLGCFFCGVYEKIRAEKYLAIRSA